jgi:hypothetical protein
MKTPASSFLILVAIVIAMVTPSHAATRTSANYAIVNESYDSAGGTSSSSNYTNSTDAGGIAGITSATSPSETNKSGFAGQLAYVTGLQLNTSFTDDGTDQPISAFQSLDDGTMQILGGTGATWAVTAGALPAGLTLDPSTGVISGTPTGSGPYSFTITVSDGLGNTAMQTFTGTAVQTFAEWESSYGISDAPGSTPYDDGVPTLLKYLYNINPTRPMTAADRAALPVADYGVPSGQTSSYITLTYRQYSKQTGLIIQVQTSADLKTWTPILLPGQPATPPDLTVPLGNDPVTNDPILEVGMLANGHNKQFIRLQVTLP